MCKMILTDMNTYTFCIQNQLLRLHAYETTMSEVNFVCMLIQRVTDKQQWREVTFVCMSIQSVTDKQQWREVTICL